MQQHHFDYIPTGHQLPLATLEKHEYFGDDFAAGKCTVGLFKTEAGKLRAIWSFGEWSTYAVKRGLPYRFRHTQTSRTQRLIYIGPLDRDTVAMLPPEALAGNVTHWTLK